MSTLDTNGQPSGAATERLARGAIASPAGNPFHALLSSIQMDLESRLMTLLDSRVDAAERQGSEVGEMVDSLRDLCRRGGKRLRPALVAVGYRVAESDAPLELALEAGMALELLQAYFLIHDDWMDQDLERRGGPTVHTHLARRFHSSSKGAAAAILTGDYAVALATSVLADLDVPGRRLSSILHCFAEMQLDAIAGQGLDVIGRSGDLERTYQLKTASYTVRGPLVMGALLAGGPPPLLQTLERLSLPAGIAFQLRDDLLGVFGNPDRTGKQRGGDLKGGKRTLLIDHALRTTKDKDHALLQEVFGNPRATERQVERAIAVLESSGARQAVEARITALDIEARRVIEEGQDTMTPTGRALLLGAIDALTARDV